MWRICVQEDISYSYFSFGRAVNQVFRSLPEQPKTFSSLQERTAVVCAPHQSATMIIHHNDRKTSFFVHQLRHFASIILSSTNSDFTGIRQEKSDTHNLKPTPIVPAQPKARWYLEVGLNLTQQTLALASMLATELSRLVDHNFTETQKQTREHFPMGKRQ